MHQMVFLPFLTLDRAQKNLFELLSTDSGILMMFNKKNIDRSFPRGFLTIHCTNLC